VPYTKYWTANFTITSDTSCPAVLTENLFQDNKEEVQYLLSEEGKRNIVELHFEAIKKYINI
jgi:N-acetylmuramoyl-L-alanine amidase